MSFFIPTDWLAKPEQWDIDVLDVCWAAEHVLGIDSSSIVGLWPFWEGAGTSCHAVIGDNGTLTAPYEWNSSILTLMGDTGKITVPNSFLLPAVGSFFSYFYVPPYTYLGRVNVWTNAYWKDTNQFSVAVETNGSTSNKYWLRVGATDIYSGTIIDGEQDVDAVYTFSWDGSTCVYNLGGLEGTASYTGTVQSSSSVDHGIYVSGNTIVKSSIYITCFFSDVLSAEQKAVLAEQPYILIRRYPRPWVFDLGAGTTLALSGSISGAATLSGAAYLAATLAGAVDAISGASGDLAAAAGLSGTLGAQAALSASARLTESLAGTLPALSTLAAEAAYAARLSGTIPGVAGASGQAAQSAKLSGTVAGVSGGSAEARLAASLAGAIEAIATLTGDLTSGTWLSLAGTISGVSAMTADASMAAALAGDIAAYAQVLDASARLRAELSGALAAAATLEADARLTETLEGLIAAAADLTGSLIVVGEAQGMLTDPAVMAVTKRWHLIPASRRRELVSATRRYPIHRA